MRDHDVLDRLGREELLRFRDVGERPRLALPGLEHHHVVLELDDERVVAARPRREPVEAVAELLGRDVERGRSAARRTAGRGARTRRAAAGASVARSDGFALAAVTSTSKNGHSPRVCTIFVGAVTPPKSVQPE